MTPDEAAAAISKRARNLIECLTISRHIAWTWNRSPDGLGDAREAPWTWGITVVFRGQIANVVMSAGELGQAVSQVLDALEVVMEKGGE